MFNYPNKIRNVLHHGTWISCKLLFHVVLVLALLSLVFQLRLLQTLQDWRDAWLPWVVFECAIINKERISKIKKSRNNYSKRYVVIISNNNGPQHRSTGTDKIFKTK